MDSNALTEVKQTIRKLKKDKAEILTSAKDHGKLKKIRRKVKLLKRETRLLAREKKKAGETAAAEAAAKAAAEKATAAG
jgi:hypothetical protein